MIDEQQDFRARALIPHARRANEIYAAYAAVPAQDVARWWPLSETFNAATTVLSLLCAIDKNWNTLIRTYEGPGK